MTTNPVEVKANAEVVVEQKHRDAAADLALKTGSADHAGYRSYVAGAYDEGAFVQAFVRFERDHLATRSEAGDDALREQTGWLVEENASGFIHWIALAKDAWPHTKVTTRRARMNSDFDIEETRYLTPVVRVKDAAIALRFAREEDAQAFIALFDRFLLHPVPTQHVWDAALATPPEPTHLVSNIDGGEVEAANIPQADVEGLLAAVGSIVSMCADHRDIFPDPEAALATITEAINELYGCLEDGVFARAALKGDGR